MAKRYKDGGNGGSMISQNSSDFANLPTGVVMKSYANPFDDMEMDMLDYEGRQESQIKGDSPRRKAGFKPAKIN